MQSHWVVNLSICRHVFDLLTPLAHHFSRTAGARGTELRGQRAAHGVAEEVEELRGEDARDAQEPRPAPVFTVPLEAKEDWSTSVLTPKGA